MIHIWIKTGKRERKCLLCRKEQALVRWEIGDLRTCESFESGENWMDVSDFKTMKIGDVVDED